MWSGFAPDNFKTVARLLTSFTIPDSHVIAVSYPVALRCVYLFRHTCFLILLHIIMLDSLRCIRNPMGTSTLTVTVPVCAS